MRAPWHDRSGKISSPKVVALCLAAVPGLWMAVDWRTGAYGPIPAIGFTYWSGLWAAVMLLATLAVTPVRHLFRLNRAIEARRILGLSSLFYSLVHTAAFGMLFRWDWAALAGQMARPTLLVATLSLAVLILLGVTSTDAAVHRLGAAGWQRLHRLNYLATGLAVLHFLLSPGLFGAQYLVAGLLFWLLAWRLLQRARRGRDPVSLGLLALGSGLFVVLAELGWLWAWQAMPPEESVTALLDLGDDLAVWWQVPAAGLAVLAATLALRKPHTSRQGAGDRTEGD